MAGLVSRASLIAKAKISKLLDKAEKPTETLDYSYEKQLELLQNVPSLVYTPFMWYAKHMGWERDYCIKVWDSPNVICYVLSVIIVIVSVLPPRLLSRYPSRDLCSRQRSLS